MRIRSVAIVYACLMLAACSGDKPATSQQQAGESLPLPAIAGGSVTGMPNPGIRSPPPPEARMSTNEDLTVVANEDGNIDDPDVPVSPAETQTSGEMVSPPVELIPASPAPLPDAVKSSVAPPPET